MAPDTSKELVTSIFKGSNPGLCDLEEGGYRSV
jgi:hypothetical protein